MPTRVEIAKQALETLKSAIAQAKEALEEAKRVYIAAANKSAEEAKESLRKAWERADKATATENEAVSAITSENLAALLEDANAAAAETVKAEETALDALGAINSVQEKLNTLKNAVETDKAKREVDNAITAVEAEKTKAEKAAGDVTEQKTKAETAAGEVSIEKESAETALAEAEKIAFDARRAADIAGSAAWDAVEAARSAEMAFKASEALAAASTAKNAAAIAKKAADETKNAPEDAKKAAKAVTDALEKAGSAAKRAKAAKDAAAKLAEKTAEAKNTAEAKLSGVAFLNPSFMGPLTFEQQDLRDKVYGDDEDKPTHEHYMYIDGMIDKVSYIDPSFDSEVQKFVAAYDRNKSMYEKISSAAGVPPELVAIIHYRESYSDYMNGRFGVYLHNGDLLGKPTVNYPPNKNFSNFYDAAIDAFRDKRNSINLYMIMADSEDMAKLLSFAERYNGMGYYNNDRVSPYLFSGTNLYTKGKYVEVPDGNGKMKSVFDKDLVDKQIGVYLLLKAIMNR